jgi:hypothetical protein
VHGRLSMNNSPVSWQRWLIRRTQVGSRRLYTS